jgi:hypothetical protein
VNHAVDPFQRFRHLHWVSDIRLPELGFGRNPRRLAVGMNTLLEAVDNADPVAPLQKQIDRMRPNETGATGN